MKTTYLMILAILVVLATASVGLADPSAGLVAYYPFNGNANDESGNGNHGTVTGATLTSDRFGNANSAYYFDGVDDWIGASADNLPTRERTVSVWFNLDIVSTNPLIMGYGGNSSGQCGFTWDQGYQYIQAHCGIDLLEVHYSEEPVGNWYNCTITTSPTGTKIYINGQLKAENGEFLETIVAGTDFIMGATVDPYGNGPKVYGAAGGYLKGDASLTSSHSCWSQATL